MARGLSVEELEGIQSTQRAGHPAVVACYTEELERLNEKKQGRVVVKILIGTDGSVQQVEIGPGTLRSPALNQCIEQAIRQWEFPRLRAATWYGTTFEFSPAY